MSISVVATISIKPEDKETVVEILKKMIEETRKEEGCGMYVLHEDPENPNSLVFIESWADDDAIQLHLESDHMKNILMPALDKYSTAPLDLKKYQTLI